MGNFTARFLEENETLLRNDVNFKRQAMSLL